MICTIKTLDFQNMKYALSAKGKQWRVGEVIDICFLEGNRSQKEFVKLTAEEWLKYANMGSWSYVGTDSLFITPQNATMNFGWLDKSTVLHEFGHMLGLLHEHQNPDGGIVWNESEVLRNLSGPPNNWSEDMIRHNVLNKVLPNTTNGTKFDPNSVMLYFFPGAWTSTGKGTKQNNSLSDIDKQYISQLYPFPNKTIQKKKNLFKKIFG